MKKYVVFWFLFLYALPILGQDGFVFEQNVDKVDVPFKFINNLIFIPIKVNGITLNFLLDSGIEETILFSMENKKEVDFFNTEKILIRGLGSESPVEALKSNKNTLEISGLKSVNHLLYVVLDQNFNLSNHVGIPVNGIIGYPLLKNNLLEINYEKKRVTIHRDAKKIRDKINKKFQRVPIVVEKLKPYVMGEIIVKTAQFPVKLLVDLGNSDAIWLFQNNSKNIEIPDKNFEEYLGKGFSGDVEGKRAQIKKFSMSKFEFNNPVIAFPDTLSVNKISMVKDRSGSVGAEILRRFEVVFDYPNQIMYLKKNSHFNTPFSYNKSGIELQHFGLQWVQETVRLETVSLNEGAALSNDFKYKFDLKPVYLISNVRKNSTAAIIGIQKNDILVSINGVSAYKYSLEKINSILKSEEEKWVILEIERKGERLKFKFQLLNVL